MFAITLSLERFAWVSCCKACAPHWYDINVCTQRACANARSWCLSVCGEGRSKWPALSRRPVNAVQHYNTVRNM
jgi:hypothetical protein